MGGERCAEISETTDGPAQGALSALEKQHAKNGPTAKIRSWVRPLKNAVSMFLRRGYRREPGGPVRKGARESGTVRFA